MQLTSRKRAVISLFAAISLALSACQFRMSVPTPTPPTTAIPATSTPLAPSPSPTPAVTSTPQAPTLEQIRPRMISGSQMLKETRQVVRLNLQGESSDGKALNGDLTVARTRSADLQQSSIVMTGSLTNRALALMNETDLTRPMQGTSVYRLKRGMFWVADYGQENYGCIKLAQNENDPFTYRSTLADTLLQNTEKYLYGTLVGEEKINDIVTQHYRLDADASNKAAQQVDDWYIKNLVRTLKLVDGDVYLAREGGYLVSLQVNYQGELSDLKFKGKIRLAYDHTYPKVTDPLTLPQACENAAARAELPDSVGKAVLLGVAPFKGPSSGVYKSQATITLNGKDRAGKAVNVSTWAQLLENRDQQRKLLTLDGTLFAGLSSEYDLAQLGLKKVYVYQIGDDVYVVLEMSNGKPGTCRNMTGDGDARAMTEVTPEELAIWLFHDGYTYGVPMERATVTVNGEKAYHYRLDPQATRNTQEADDESDSAGHRPELVSGDVYIAESGYHLVRMTANYTGQLLSFDFSGRIKLQYDLTSPTDGADIQLPSACQNAGNS